MKAKLIARYTAIKNEANEYLDRLAANKQHGITALASHRWAVVLDEPGYSMAVTLDKGPGTLALKVVRGHLCGTTLFTREDAATLAATWRTGAPAGLQNVRIILDEDLVNARKVEAERLLAELSTY